MPQKLDRSPLLLEFKRILADQASGTLEVTGKDFRKRLIFSRGIIVNADSSLPDEGLSVILQNCGLISGDILDEDDDVFADLLVQRGILQQGEVEFARLHRIRLIALSIFSLPRGAWVFAPGDPLPEGRIRNRVHPADILSDVIPTMENIYYFREIFNRSRPQFTSMPRNAAARIYERQYSLYQRMCRLDADSHDEIRKQLDINEQDYWETLTLFFLLGGVSFPDSTVPDEIKHRREMICRWQDQFESGTLDFHELLGIVKDADMEAVEKAFADRVRDYHPDALQIPPDSSLYSISQAVLKQMENARIQLSRNMDPREPRPVPPQVPREEQENPVKKAQLQFQEALEHKSGNRFIDAIRCLETAIRLDPKRAKYYHQLGLNQMHLPAFRKNAEQNLKKAAEMEPWNADPVYSLGVLFRSAGLRRLSEKYFRRALEINMDHTKAGLALQGLTSGPGKGRLGKRFKN